MKVTTLTLQASTKTKENRDQSTNGGNPVKTMRPSEDHPAHSGVTQHTVVSSSGEIS